MLQSLSIICVALALSPLYATAQKREAPPSSGSMSGLVVDAATTLPLAGANVVLEPRTMGAFPVRPAGASAFVQATRATTTDSAGRYRFEGVPKGDYSLHVQRLGYRSTTLAVELRGSTDSRVSIGLDVEAVALQPLEVSAPGPTTTPPANSYRRTVPTEVRGDARLTAERLRQRQHLSSDVRAITHADVVEGITLGETDLFRALQRLPGVSTRDDYSAELWTRGAPWDQTRVTFDGLPLFNPLHAAGMFSAVNPDAVGAASFHPGVQPAATAGGAAGTLDLRSRRGTGDAEGGLQGLGELSLVSARLALDRQFAGGRGAWMLAARRTYLDWLVGGIGRLIDDPEVFLPYAFSDLAGRVDYQLDAERSLEVSGLFERDQLSGDLPDVVQGNTMTWGNAAARTTLSAPLWGGTARHTLGMSRFASRIQRHASPYDSVYSAPNAPASDNTIAYGVLSGEWTRLTHAVSAPWTLGYQLERYAADYTGPGLNPYIRQAPEDTLIRSALVVGAIWGERRWRPWQSFTLDAGLRLEASEALRTADPLRLAPRISARYQPAPSLLLSAGLGRSFQYTHSLAGRDGTRFGLGLLLPGSDLWILAGDEVPPIRSDIATLGIESWIGNAWLASVNSYVRWQNGLAIPDPTPGSLLDRPLFVPGTGEAHGVEVAARKLAGRWTASLGYSYAVSEMEAAGLRYPAPTERRHTLDATSMLRLGRSFRVGAAYTAASGAPYARMLSGSVICDDRYDPAMGGVVEGACQWADPPRVEAPGAHRTPTYQSLDLLFDWQRAFRRWEFGAYLQVRNAFNYKNAGPYLGYNEMYCPRTQVSCSSRGGPGESYIQTDIFADAPPILPVFGFRIAF